MSQPSVTAYFNSRKRGATDEIRNKAKVLVLERERTTQHTSDSTRALIKQKLEEIGAEEVESEPKLVYNSSDERESTSIIEKVNPAVRNIQFDTAKTSSTKTPKMLTRARATRAKKFVAPDGQPDIRETFLKINNEMTNDKPKNVPFEKKGALSPKKNLSGNKSATPKKADKSLEKTGEQPAAGCTTPTKATFMDRLARQELGLGEIKSRINKSSRLGELKDRIDRIKRMEKKLDELQNQDEPQPKIKKFDTIHFEIPISPHKARSPMKTPTKNIQLPSTASPQRRLLFAPKESTPSPVKISPTKTPAYQRYQSIADSGTCALPLPYNYRFLAEVFRCIDTVINKNFIFVLLI